ncbi:hypothetical protein HDU98_011157 [Podochytrium sp. JEL0797]|nr:hypothetical protein HDU98_011157 [Podochytrium sp. JEL0797]
MTKPATPPASLLVLSQSSSATLFLAADRLSAPLTLLSASQAVVAKTNVTLFPHANDGPCPATRLTFNAPIDVSTASVSISHNVLRIAAKTAPSAHFPHIEPFSSNADSLTSISALSCHACKSPLAPTPVFSKIADLPSEHWHELLDCWACHQEDYSHLQKGHFGSVIPSRKRNLLVAQNYLLVHESDLDMDQLDIDVLSGMMKHLDVSQPTDHDHNAHEDHDHDADDKNVFKPIQWSSISCKCCHMPLGDALAQPPPLADPDAPSPPPSSEYIALRLFKHCVDIRLDSGTFHRPYISYFVNELLESADSHASYKFIVSIGNSNKPALMVWLLNWNILYGISSATSPLDLRVSPAIKVGFLLCSKQNETILGQWDADKQVERMQVEAPFYKVLVDTLETSHGDIVAIEEADKQLNGFKFAYLQR